MSGQTLPEGLGKFCQRLRIGLAKDLFADYGKLAASKTVQGEPTGETSGGSDPRSPAGDFVRRRAEKWGRARPLNDFCRVQFLGMLHRFVF